MRQELMMHPELLSQHQNLFSNGHIWLLDVTDINQAYH
jgi:hypothetical protein